MLSSMMLNLQLEPRHTVNQSIVGSIFLIFQAVHPYIVYRAKEPLTLTATGGTNVSNAPSFEYIDQVLVPNLRRLGLPESSVQLHKRGRSMGPRDLGLVSFSIHPIGLWRVTAIELGSVSERIDHRS